MSFGNSHLPRILFGIFVVFLAITCKQSTQTSESTEESTQTTENKYIVTPFSSSPEFPDAAITKMEYRDGRFTFGIAGESYRLGMQTTDATAKGCANSAEGQHIHLIVDNMPYAAKYENTFEYDIPDGEHYVLAFLSRSYHESLKNREAAIAVKATVANKSFGTTTPVSGPMLFYSRPKGAYEGDDAKRVLLDYYLVNPNPEHKVQATINGEVHVLPGWQPYIIEGLPAGENEITLTLVDNTGQRVNTDLNPVSRKFVLNPNPPEN